MRFTKMHALGNNYIYVSTIEQPIEDGHLPHLARVVSDVRRGIGADGLILVEASDVADVGMRIFNADGSEAETCGNGLRCVAKYAYEHQLVVESQFSIETKGGTVQAQVHLKPTGQVDLVTIDMGVPKFGASSIVYKGQAADGDDVALDVGDTRFVGTVVNMGNPHWITYVDQIDDGVVESIGPSIESHPDFPERINAEFVRVVNDREIEFRVYERGSGVTYACGTGACASVAALIRKGMTSRRVTVHLLGGDLEIEQRSTDDHILMTGEAVTVAEGNFVWTSK